MTAQAARVHGRRTLRERRRDFDPFQSFNVALTLLVAIPFFVAPLLLMVAYSFATQSYVTGSITFGWSTGGWSALNDPIVISGFGRSLLLATYATAGCAVIGYPLAYFIARHGGRFRNVLLTLVIVPFWVSFIVRAYAWLDLLGRLGPINHELVSLGIVGAPIQLEYNQFGIAVGIVYSYLVVMVFPIYVSVERISPEVLEAARDLGASRFSTFRRIVFPQALPGLVAGCTLVWIPALGEYVIPTILGGGKTLMIGNLIEFRFLESFAWPEGAAMSVCLMLFALAFLGVVMKILGAERLGVHTVTG
jgi:ABC-type spermidine/putrescine transport system permease subunit I